MFVYTISDITALVMTGIILVVASVIALAYITLAIGERAQMKRIEKFYKGEEDNGGRD